MKLHYSPQAGFSLVETLVAITILLIVITGPLAVSVNTARSTNFASEQTVAFFLAQEGAELMQIARDNLVLDSFSSGSVAWDAFTDETGTYAACYEPEGCGVELGAGGLIVHACSDPVTPCRLFFDDGNFRNVYTYDDSSGNEEMLYSRIITLENISSDYVRVESRVVWRTGSLRDVQEVKVETYLYNVYGN